MIELACNDAMQNQLPTITIATVLSDKSTHYQPDNLLIRAPAGRLIRIILVAVVTKAPTINPTTSGNPENSAVESRTPTSRVIILAVAVVVLGLQYSLQQQEEAGAASRQQQHQRRLIHPDFRKSGNLQNVQ